MEPSTPRNDVAIIGGGVVGVACALELARRGATVRVLERDLIGHGCSFGNAGWLTPSLAMPLAAPGQTLKAVGWLLDRESPFYIRPRLDPALALWLIRFFLHSRRAPYERGARALVELARLSVDWWEDLAASGSEFEFERKGLVLVYETKAALAAGIERACFTEQFGVPFETWEAERVRREEPAVEGAQVGGLFFPDDAQCDPFRAVQALAAEAERHGVRFEEQAEVLDVTRNGSGNLLRTARETFRAGDVVLAAGAWSGSLGRRLGLRLPMLGAKGYSVLAPRCDPHPSRSIYLAERKIALNPHRDALRIAGTLELVGEDLSVDRRRASAMIRGARAMLKTAPIEPESADVWSGLRPCTSDGMPAIGRTREGLWLATGHQMTGLKTAPASGRLLAELLCGETPSVDPTPFRADRF
jgi:D-amino-acid dehydrogenase